MRSEFAAGAGADGAVAGQHGAQASTPARHIYLIALALTLAYLLVIVHASLQPWRGWRLPPQDLYGFLAAPWPRYITPRDVAINLAAYIPFGFLLALALRLALPVTGAVLLAAALATGVTITMESAQMFLPARIPSNVDVIANGMGALIGALAAPLFLPRGAVGARLGVWRDRIFVRGALADVGIVIVLLWIIAHLNPLTQVFGTGLLRETFDLPDWLSHTPGRLLTSEAAVVFFNLLGIGLLLSTVMREYRHRGLVIIWVIVAALALKMLIFVLIGKPHGAWAWMTPGVLLGLLLGGVLLAGLLSLGLLARMALALLCTLLALAVINFAPDNPYFSLPPTLASGKYSHILSLSGILRAISELWPLLALGYLVTALWARGRRHL